MPYAPTERFDSRVLYEGFADAGKSLASGLDRMLSNRRKMDNLDASAAMLAKAHPDVLEQLGGADVLEKYSKGGMGQREALVGQLTAGVMEKYKQKNLDIQQSQIDESRHEAEVRARTEAANRASRENLATEELDRTHPKGWKPSATITSGTDANGNPMPTVISAQTAPYSGYVQVVPQTKLNQPQPDGTIIHDAHGNELGVWAGGEVKMDQYKLVTNDDGMSQTMVNTRTGKPLALGSQPTGGAGAGTAAAAQPAAAPKYEAGKVYRDAKGNRARYNKDGSWTPIK